MPAVTRFAELVESILDQPADGSKTKREAVAELLVERLLDGDRTAWKLYLARAWPVPNLVELSADVSLRSEMERAARELDEMLGLTSQDRLRGEIVAASADGTGRPTSSA